VLRDEVKLAAIVNNDPKLKNLRGEALLNALWQHDFVTGKPKLQNYLRRLKAKLDSIKQVAASPEEAEAINQILAVSFFDLGADNDRTIFSDVLVRIDSSTEISDTTKEKVQKLFGVKSIKTGGDVNDTLARGRGVDEKGERLPFDEAHKAQIAPHNYIYEEADGKRTYEINLPDGRIFKTHFPPNSSDTHTGDLGIFMGNLYAAESLGLADAIFQRGWQINHGGTIEVHYDDIIKAKRLNQVFIGNTAGYDNGLLGYAQINRLKHDYQALSRQGDLATGDNDPQRQCEDYKELGILTPDGAIDWQQFERAADYLQRITAKGGIPEFDDLKGFLNRRTKSYH